jgi:predicted Zn finger-like uncharacterized protein
MTIVECPSCQAKIDVDRADVEKEEDGLDLIVRCPPCGNRFIIQRVKIVRQKLKVAKYGYTKNKDGEEIRIKLNR